MISFVYLLMSYFLGTIVTAYIIGKIKKVDLQSLRSGNLGARNAGANLGKSAFIITALFDALKGLLTILIGHALELPTLTIATAGLLVILGHIFPFWLKFKGGKGIATFLGVSLGFPPFFLMAFIIGLIVSIPLFRSATLGMLVGYIAYIGVIFYQQLLFDYYPIIIAIIIIIYKHRAGIKASFSKRFSKAKVDSSDIS